MKHLIIVLLISLAFSCAEQTSNKASVQATSKKTETARQIMDELKTKGYQTFDYIDEKTKDTMIMQQYFIAFLKRGPNRSQSQEVVDSLQILHLRHLGRMYEEGYADISGPFGDDGDIRGITIYNTPTFEIADSLARMDPMVKVGRLHIEMHPWWAGKGFPLR